MANRASDWPKRGRGTENAWSTEPGDGAWNVAYWALSPEYYQMTAQEFLVEASLMGWCDLERRNTKLQTYNVFDGRATCVAALRHFVLSSTS